LNYILDACALIAVFKDEDGGPEVNDLITRAETDEISLCVSIVNLIEVHYGNIRDFGLEKALEILEIIKSAQIEVIGAIPDAVFYEASRLKAAYSLSLADAIGLATATNRNGLFVTADGEFAEAEAREQAPIHWFRPPKKR
jgi:predicted nucleic acid-binding protein